MTFIPTAPAGLMQAQVVAASPPNRLLVMIPAWGVGTRVPVRFPTHGQNDALRTRQVPMPKPGSWGGVQFVNQDSRNGVWMFTDTPALANAHTNAAGDGDVTYESENSGYWHWRDGTGAETTTYPDGTTITVSPSGVPSQPTRTVVENQMAVVQPLTQDQRTLSAKPAVQIAVRLSSGLTWTLSGTTATLNGNLVVDGAITATGNVTAGEGSGDQVDLQGHNHKVSGVQTGSSTLTTTAPVAGS